MLTSQYTIAIKYYHRQLWLSIICITETPEDRRLQGSSLCLAVEVAIHSSAAKLHTEGVHFAAEVHLHTAET